MNNGKVEQAEVAKTFNFIDIVNGEWALLTPVSGIYKGLFLYKSQENN